jgi:hypothetical protein
MPGRLLQQAPAYNKGIISRLQTGRRVRPSGMRSAAQSIYRGLKTQYTAGSRSYSYDRACKSRLTKLGHKGSKIGVACPCANTARRAGANVGWGARSVRDSGRRNVPT